MPTQLQIEAQTTVRELVGQYPETRPVFEKYGIDYCCGGARSLADAAADHNLQLAELTDALTEVTEAKPASEGTSERDRYAAPLSELVEHIVATHHSYVKTALPRIQSLITKVLDAHRVSHGDTLTQVQTHFDALETELTSHMMKEEQMLFPYVTALDRHSREGTDRPQAPFGSVQNPVRQMEHEHDSAGDALQKLRFATSNYTLPDDACPTFETLYEELKRFEADLHQHIHLENNILFPRAIELERV